MKDWGKSLLVIMVILLCTSYQARSDMFCAGEKLVYRVSYLGITLGYIKINTEEKTVYNGHECYVTKGYMRSNPNIPFVDLQAIYKSWSTDNIFFFKLPNILVESLLFFVKP